MRELLAFVAVCDGRSDLQQAISCCTSPQEIIDLAAKEGHGISIKALRSCSRDLAAAYWPWSQKGHAWRRAFFAS
ncbi:putative nif11-like leader peptide domain protein [Synechococcus sp. RS9909]|nr:putative nif11-like leader peptide domain protein [Synechococcus sp. RS9909]